MEQALQSGGLYLRSSRPHQTGLVEKGPPTCFPAHPVHVVVCSGVMGDLMDAGHPAMIGQRLDSRLVLVERIGYVASVNALSVKSFEVTYSSWLYLLPSLM